MNQLKILFLNYNINRNHEIGWVPSKKALNLVNSWLWWTDLSFQIIGKQEDLMDVVDHDKISPLHVLARKPIGFRSRIHLGSFNKIIYHCQNLQTKPKNLQVSNRDWCMGLV